ncbi:MAG: hypothetical protein J5657_01205, partial [Clostridiales bacterium]|nr:hypothetical protein [Clostridiales bacterium]
MGSANKNSNNRNNMNRKPGQGSKPADQQAPWFTAPEEKKQTAKPVNARNRKQPSAKVNRQGQKP